MEKKLAYFLTEIFKAVADACDGEHDGDNTEHVPTNVRKAYEKAMKNPQVLRFYGKLVDQRNGAYLDYARPGDLRDDEPTPNYSDQPFDHNQI